MNFFFFSTTLEASSPHVLALPLDGSGENLHRRTRHENVVRFSVPFKFQIATLEVDQNFSLGIPGQNSRDAHGRCSRSTGQGLAGPTLPDAHFQLGRGNDLNKLDVRACRENRVMFHELSDFPNQVVCDLIDEGDAVWITH